ncbi:MAG TPA: glycosyltransferase family 4 protein [Candidatus Acidoferrum sp.]|nr:glycosyltransferase family 4 protein [Candidatus Acidoferrum sp.]
MKIALIARPLAFHGGVERATAGLVEALVARGHDVHLLSPGATIAPAGVTLHRLRLPRLPATARVLALAALAGRAVAAGRWDVVQSHERTLRQHVYRAGEGCHRAYLASGASSRPRMIYDRVVQALEARVFAATPRLVAIARQGQREIERLFGIGEPRVRVIYNGVDLERFHPDRAAAQRAPARGEAGIDGDEPVLLFAGSGYERKGLATAIEALPRLDHARLIVVGRGDETRYRRLATALGVSDRVAWLGLRRDLERWYGAADLLVLPTRYEPFGNVHLEALASGLAVVTTTAAGGAEVVEEGKNGAVIAPGDARALANAVSTLLGENRGALAEAARRAAEPYTHQKQAEAFERLYREFP